MKKHLKPAKSPRTSRSNETGMSSPAALAMVDIDPATAKEARGPVVHVVDFQRQPAPGTGNTAVAGALAVKKTPAGGDSLRDEATLAEKLVAEVAADTSDVNDLCGKYKLRREELGRLTGFSLRALADWASGELPSQPAKRRLQEVRRLLDALAEIVKQESIPQWLHRRNTAFGNLTPLQVIEVGEMDRLWAMVHELGSGQLE